METIKRFLEQAQAKPSTEGLIERYKNDPEAVKYIKQLNEKVRVVGIKKYFLLLNIIERQSTALNRLTKGNWPKDKRKCKGDEISQTMLEGNCELARDTLEDIKKLINE